MGALIWLVSVFQIGVTCRDVESLLQSAGFLAQNRMEGHATESNCKKRQKKAGL